MFEILRKFNNINYFRLINYFYENIFTKIEVFIENLININCI